MGWKIGGQKFKVKKKLNDSLLATPEESGATTKKLAGDQKARVANNYSGINDLRVPTYRDLVQATCRGKRVLHMKCGMGLLSMMAAHRSIGGAASVVAMDASDIIKPAQRVARDNHFSESKLQFAQAKDYAGLAAALNGGEGGAKDSLGGKFDVVLCEWFGGLLTDEPVLDEVLKIKRNHLNPGGFIAPDTSSLHIVGVSDYHYRQTLHDYWENVYGFKMDKTMRPLTMNEVQFTPIPAYTIATSSSCVKSISLEEIGQSLQHCTSKEEMLAKKAYSAPFSITATRQCTLHDLSFFVECSFNHPKFSFTMGGVPTPPPLASSTGFHGSVPPLQQEQQNSPPHLRLLREASVALHNPLPVKPGDVVSGHLSVTPTAVRQKTMVEVSAKVTNNVVGTLETTGTYTYNSAYF